MILPLAINMHHGNHSLLHGIKNNIKWETIFMTRSKIYLVILTKLFITQSSSRNRDPQLSWSVTVAAVSVGGCNQAVAWHRLCAFRWLATRAASIRLNGKISSHRNIRGWLIPVFELGVSNTVYLPDTAINSSRINQTLGVSMVVKSKDNPNCGV